MARKIQRYGWRRDSLDHRDRRLAHEPTALGLPSEVDLRPQCPAPYDQGQIGSCTANAIAFAYEFDLRKQGKAEFVPSRLFIYYGERLIEGTVKSDSGAEIRDGMIVISKTGVAKEATWPYVEKRFATKPSVAAYTQAAGHKAVSYLRVDQTEAAIKGCLAAGFPVVFGFNVFEAFESDAVAQSGVLPSPSAADESIGGHAVALVGYDDATRRFLVRNSWGAEWGVGGYFWMPYDYVLNAQLADDFWTVRSVTQ